jgi:spore maturation protein CgeB
VKRVLVVHPGPNFSVADVHTGWIEALQQLGLMVFPYNLDDRLAFYDSTYLPDGEGGYRKALSDDQAIGMATNGIAAALFKIRPHILLSVSSFFVDFELLKHAMRTGTQVVLVHTESPYEDDRQLGLAPHATQNLINDPTNIDRFRTLGPTEYVPHAYRPSLHIPGPPVPELACDLAFVGTGYPSREEFFNAMDFDGLEVRLGGNWMRLPSDSPLRKHVMHDIDECMDNEDAVPLYRSAKVGINFYRREAAHPELQQGWAMGPREVEMAACGLFFLRDPRGEGDEVLLLPTFSDPDDASEKVRWFLAHDGARQAMADKAREAIADRTFTNNAKRLLELLDRKE